MELRSSSKGEIFIWFFGRHGFVGVYSKINWSEQIKCKADILKLDLCFFFLYHILLIEAIP
jgi:hypothetical protein